MEPTERESIERINHALDRTDARDGKSVLIMVATALVATALVLGMTWMNTARQEDASSRMLTEQQ